MSDKNFKLRLSTSTVFFNKSLFQNNKAFLEPTLLNEISMSNVSLSLFRVPFDYTGEVLAASFILPMAVLGIFCNIVTILVIYNTKKLNSIIFNNFIASLSISDLISAIISPLMFYRKTWGYDRWNLPEFLCKIYWGGDLITSIATSLHILVFCSLRFLAIAKPHLFKQIRLINAKICILVIWVVSIACGGCTYGVWIKVIDVDRTKQVPNRHWPHCTINLYWIKEFENFGLYGHAVFYYFPPVGVIILSIGTSLLLLRHRTQRRARLNKNNSVNEVEIKRRKNENQAIIQLVLIVVSYLFGYIPISVYYIVTPKSTNEPLKWWFNMISYICMRLTECFNPFFYNLGSRTLRTETLKLLRQMLCCKRISCPTAKANNGISTKHEAAAIETAAV